MTMSKEALAARLQQIETIRQRALAEIKALLPDADNDQLEVEVNVFPDPEAVPVFQQGAREAGWLFDKADDPQLGYCWYKSTGSENGGRVTVYL